MEDFLLKLSIMLVPGLLAITCHEVSHGFVAWRFGDPTARMLGRLTLNPLKHVDPLGTIIVPIFIAFSTQFRFIFGWAKPVPVVYENLRNPKRDMIWVAAAGPITNFILAIISAIILRGILSLTNIPMAAQPTIMFIIKPIELMLEFSVYINLLLGLFNLIPVPPLDGGRVFIGLLPPRLAYIWSRLEPYGILLVIGLFYLTGLSDYLFVIVNFLSLILVGSQVM
jgi:Zn-dependent protease